ncbi:2OG-Fe dioxygenase family protein [Vreelandella andesensis]|uniref:2OG-Fe dioxygenase family protein n=1 Tax=Vreelandella andesensis TaxID=447567 RepID=UPI002449A044|nr:2OG-Fe dioxygenase family protein [Halomonas andesensis]
MSWLVLNDQGDVEDMGQCPMAQGGAFNDAESMADRRRYYDPLTREFIVRPDVKAFVRAWARLWSIGAHEPILMQITGVRGEGNIDPSGTGNSCRWVQSPKHSGHQSGKRGGRRKPPLRRQGWHATLGRYHPESG